MNIYTTQQAINSLFTKGGTLPFTGIEITKRYKHTVYFTYKHKDYCLNKWDVILKYSILDNGKKYYQIACLDFDYMEYKEIVSLVKQYKTINRG